MARLTFLDRPVQELRSNPNNALPYDASILMARRGEGRAK